MAAPQEVSENWDDDFEFQVERRKMSTKSEATENWDDDFEDSSPKKIVQRNESWDDEDDDESGEFGLFAEEDRTVTAKSRRAALARLAPLPPLVRSLPGHPQPRSPTSSVFSVPTTIHTYSSTTYLRPTSAFASIPPSPPIHKERERRRLRKKSRPKPHGVFELTDISSTFPQERRSFSDEADLTRPASERRTAMSSRSDLSSVNERTPSLAAAATAATADTSIGSSNGPISIPSTPTKGAALLSRIGSVKKWGVRRKRGDSTTPVDTNLPSEPPVNREPIANLSKWDPRRRRRGDSTTPADTIPSGSRTEDTHPQSQLNSIISYLPTPGKARRRGGSMTPEDVISNDRRKEADPRLTPRASSSLSSYQHQHQHLPPHPPLPSAHPPPPPAQSSSSAPQLQVQQQRAVSTSSNWFFRSASKSSNNTTNTSSNTSNTTNATGNSELESTSSASPSVGVVRAEKSRSSSRSGRERRGEGGGDGRNGNPNPNNSNPYSTGTPKGSRTDLSEREESAVSRKVSGSGKRRRGATTSGAIPSIGAGNPNPNLPLLPTTPPTKLVKRKSLGFVHLGRRFGGHGGGENEVVWNVDGVGDGEGEGGDGGVDGGVKQGKVARDVMQEKYAGLGLGRVGAGVRGGGGGDDVDGDEQLESTPKRSRRRSLSRLLMDREKEKEKDGVREKVKEKESEDSQQHLSKEGTRSFMGSVRRISLVSVGVVGRHKKSKSGGGFIVGVGGGGSPARIPPLPPVLASRSQVSLRIASSTDSSQPYISPEASNTDLPRATSLSSPDGPGDLTSSASAAVAAIRPTSGSTSRPSSACSSTTRRRRLSKPKIRKSEERRKSEEFLEARDRMSSLDLQPQERDEPSHPYEETDPKTPTRSSASAAVSQPPLPTAAAVIPLLPPIELQPPSPPRTAKKHTQSRSRAYTTSSEVEGLELVESLVTVTPSVFFAPSRNISAGILPLPPLSPKKLSPGKSPSQSQQSVSLGRSTAVNAAGVATCGDDSTGLSLVGGGGVGGGGGGLLRRNSLGDLKIPARISQAQVGLRRDLGMVREFASNVEQLKELQTTYKTLVVEVQALLDTRSQRVQSPPPPPPPPQPVEQSPPAATIPQSTASNFFMQLKPRSKTRARSNTNPTPPTPALDVDLGSFDVAATSSQAAYRTLVEAFWNINSKYRISWECAELLIELGGGDGGGGEVMSAPPMVTTTSVSAPVIQQHLIGAVAGDGKMSSLKGRERTITLVGDESKHSTTPPTSLATHNESQTDVPSQPSSAVVSMTGSSSMPGGMQSANTTNSGPPLASPPSMSWRASTGRHDLSQRQLVLLRDMLNNNDNGTGTVAASGDDDDTGLRPPPSSHLSIPIAEDAELRSSALPPYPSSTSHSPFLVNRDWRWGDARNSTITLPEEQESGFVDECGGGGRKDRKMEREKKRRSGRLGMNGIRDMLRSLKKSQVEGPRADVGEEPCDQRENCQHYHRGRLLPAVPTTVHAMVHSATSLSTESSIGSKSVLHQDPVQQQQNRLPIPRIPSQLRRRGRSSTGPESMRSNKVPSPTSFNPSSFSAPKSSPRRPSLASIFRIGSGNGNKNTRPASSIGVVHTGVDVGGEHPVASSSAFSASEHDLSAAQCSSATTGTGGEDSNSTGEEEEEEDWDRMDSASDLDAAAAIAAAKELGVVDGAYDISATVRGRSGFKTRRKAGVSPYLQHQPSYDSDFHQHPPPLPPSPPPPLPPLVPASSSSTGLGGFLARHSIIPKRSFSASQSSFWNGGDGQQQHPPNLLSRLSRHPNFEGQQQPTNVEAASLRISASKSAPIATTAAGVSRLPNMTSGTPSRPSSSRSTKFPNVKTGSVRSMPPHLIASSLLPTQPSPLSSLPDPKLAMIMTPENIKPLLENAKEVHAKLHECIAEIRALMEDAAAMGYIDVKRSPVVTQPALIS